LRPERAKSENKTVDFALSGRKLMRGFDTQGVALCWVIKGFQPFYSLPTTKAQNNPFFIFN